MKFLWALLLAVPLVAETVPGRYIVQLATEPVSTHVRGQGRGAILSPAAQRHRARLRSEQAAARARVQAAEGSVSAAIENVQNALVVEIDDAKAARLASLPGVRKVYPVRTFRLMLDHATALHKVPAAWSQAGGGAGAGIRIAIIDTGVDVRHPGFQDGGFTAPDGFPRGDLAHTNNKIIVARSYVSLLRRPDADESASDRIGHGTATAMAAAGVTAAGPLATITGVAPRAYVGSYKVFGSPASNPTTTEDVVMRAIDDAVADGMDIINLSLGTDIAYRLEDDAEMQAVENAAALGIIVICAAGNAGPDPMTTGSPAGAPSVIAVGATGNDRLFSTRVIAGSRVFRAEPGSGSVGAPTATGRLVDVAPLDGDGLACNPLPGTALAGAVALISRGSCNFEVKLNYAMAAGAVAAVVYNNVEGALPIMAMGTATLPGASVSLEDGATLREQAAAGGDVTVEFVPGPIYRDPNRLESFSSTGPHVEFTIKPDMTAVGSNLYTAAQSTDPRGAVYDASGFRTIQGTSFSAPIVAGAAAVLKAARPGLTAAQYRSLLVNTAAQAWSSPGTRARIQQAGAGNLDVLAAVTTTAAAAPVSLSFGISAGTAQLARELTVWNLGSTTETFRLSVVPLRGNTVPELARVSVEVEPGKASVVPVSFAANGLLAGEYEGFIEIQGAGSTGTSRVPYWHAVGTGQPGHVTVVSVSTSGAAGAVLQNAVLFRVSDEFGLPVTGILPTISMVSGGGEFAGLRVFSSTPYLYGATLRLGPRAGANVFRIEAGGIVRDVTIPGQ